MSRSARVIRGLCAALCMALSPISNAVELLHWQRLPLSLPLVVGQERVVFLDTPVRVGVPSAMAPMLRVQSAGATLYLLASKPISPTRLQLQAVNSGELILLDVEAVTGDAPLEPVRIVSADQAPEHSVSVAAVEPSTTPVPVALTRYAAQNLYAPLRTVEALPGVQPMPLRLQGELRLLPTEQISSTALAAWRLNGYWVTAVKLQNRGRHAVQLDPRHLKAELYTASFQHLDLGPAGTPEDTTVAYLITHGAGLEQALSLPASGGDTDER